MTEEDPRATARTLLTELTADVLAWAEWAQETGARAVPRDESPPLEVASSPAPVPFMPCCRRCARAAQRTRHLAA